MAEAATAEALPEGVSVTLLTPEAVLGLRAPLVERLEEAIAQDIAPIETAEDVIEQALVGKTQIWLVHEANSILGVVTTVLVQHPRCKVARVIYLAGEDFERWRDIAVDQLDAFARQHGCAALEFFSPRRGWTKHARALGVTAIGTLYRRALED